MGSTPQATMDCPICFSPITASTGQMTTSCGHSYHFSCIANWYAKQEAQTCPCCRAAPADTENMPDFSDDESDASDESDDTYEEDEVEFTREQLQAFLKRRGGLGLAEASLDRVCSVVGGFTFSEIRMLCVGNDARPLTNEEWAEDWSAWRNPASPASTEDVLNPEE